MGSSFCGWQPQSFRSHHSGPVQSRGDEGRGRGNTELARGFEFRHQPSSSSFPGFSLSLSLSPLEKAEEGMQVASVCSFDEELPITGTWLSYVRTCLRPNGSLSTAGGRPLFPERRQRLLGLGCPPNKLSPPSLPCVEYVTMLWHRSEKLAPGTARNGVFHYYYY